MERLTSYEYSNAISFAFGLLPIRIANMFRGVHFFTGTDPVYAGLHKYEDTDDGRSYRNIAHACYPHHIIDESLTIILPTLEDAKPYIVIHELGHILDYLMHFSHNALPINDYAKTNRREAFAESFAAQYFWFGEEAKDVFQSDRQSQYLFENLRSNQIQSGIRIWGRSSNG